MMSAVVSRYYLHTSNYCTVKWGHLREGNAAKRCFCHLHTKVSNNRIEAAFHLLTKERACYQFKPHKVYWEFLKAYVPKDLLGSKSLPCSPCKKTKFWDPLALPDMTKFYSNPGAHRVPRVQAGSLLSTEPGKAPRHCWERPQKQNKSKNIHSWQNGHSPFLREQSSLSGRRHVGCYCILTSIGWVQLSDHIIILLL